MNKKKAIWIAGSASALALGVGIASVATSEAPAKTMHISSTVRAPMGVVAGATDNPMTYLSDENKSWFAGVVTGKVVAANYWMNTSTEGKTVHFQLSFPDTVATIAIDKSTSTDISGDIKVFATGALLPSKDGSADTYTEYLGTGDGHALKVGDEVLLFLEKTTGSVTKLADYTVIGAAYGTFVRDETTGAYVRTSENGTGTLSSSDLKTIFDSN